MGGEYTEVVVHQDSGLGIDLVPDPPQPERFDVVHARARSDRVAP